MIPGRFPYKPFIVDLAIEAAWIHGVTSNGILSDCRSAPLVRARRYVWRRLKAQGFSLTAIGDLTNRDHTTVRHGLLGR